MELKQYHFVLFNPPCMYSYKIVAIVHILQSGLYATLYNLVLSFSL